MSKPYIHAQASVRRYGGVLEDYLPIHQHLDSSKGAIADNRHRALTHNSWYIGPGGPLELIFGVVITNSDGKEISTRQIGEDHILEDYGKRFIPSASDWLNLIEYKDWMNNGIKGCPDSHKKVSESQKELATLTYKLE